MDVTSYLLWLHFLGMVAGLGAGIALALVGPRLVAASSDQRDTLWALEKGFSTIGQAGLAILLVTGPLMVWLRYGGFQGFSYWFWIKMLLVLIVVMAVAAHTWAARRFHNGDKTAVPVMFMSGRVAGISMALAMLAAVFTFN